MSDPYLGEIRIFSFGIVPRGWLPCNGQVMAIAQNQALFSILGTTYGGNGQTTFALPDLRGRASIHQGPQIPLGANAGEEAHTLSTAEMPVHNHFATASANPIGTATATGNYWGSQVPFNLYGSAPNTTMLPLGAAGGSQPHDNMQPYLTVNFCIATTGIYPSRN